MVWYPSNPLSENELGEYLPEDDAQLQEGSEPIHAKNPQEAEKKCKKTAAEYDAVESKANPTDSKDKYDCRFKFWS